MKNKTYEQRKFKRKETLGQYLCKRITEGLVNCRKTWSKIPDEDELDFYIQQYKIKECHSKWSERYKINMWIEDEK
tara:strand:+ start:264 stop:491 length:228 start_codon:yes stop_codon:yes gene_type:complete